MAVPVARVHLKVAHAALPALLPTPPKWKMMLPPLLPTPCLAAILPTKPLANAKPGRADPDGRWDAHKPGRADSVERWDAHKKAAIPASSSSSFSSSGTSSFAIISSKSPISRASSAERWDVHKKRRPSQADADQRIDGSDSSSTGSNDIDTEEEEEILWKPRDMYAGPGFVAAVPEPTILPMPTVQVV